MASASGHLVSRFGMFLKQKEERKKMPVEAAVKKTKKPSWTKQRPMKQLVEKAKKIEEEEAEEFEPTPQGTRPALCIGKRRPKVIWKKEIKREEDSSSPASPSQMEEKVEPLKDALAELTLKKQRLEDTVGRLRQRLARRNKRIEKLMMELKELKTTPKSEEGKGSSTTVDTNKDGMELIKKELEVTKKQLEKEQGETERNKAEIHTLLKEAKKKSEAKDRKKKKKDEEESESKTAVATRILQVMKRNQLLEKALPIKESNILAQFFTSGEQTEPSHEMLTLLDKAISIGIEQLVRSTHELDDPVDNGMRALLIQTNKAKTALLVVMLTEPSFLPLAWGGKTVQAKNTEQPKKNVEVEKESKKEKGEKTSKLKEQKSFAPSSYFPVYPKK